MYCTESSRLLPWILPCLIMGETGTGKELMARALHRLSPHGKRALVKVNCAALPGELIESELFGREKGAFTGATTTQLGRFELAKGSTLFLDEIGELPLELQAKLLRVLESGEFERLGSSAHLALRCPHHRRHQPRSGRRSAQRPFPRGSVVSVEGFSDYGAPPA